MNKKIILTIVLFTTLEMSSFGGVIWNFDSPSSTPSDIKKFGYFYVYTSSTVKGKGVNGSNALEIKIPAHNRTFGGGFELSSKAVLNLTSPSTTSILYGFVAADKPNTFGVAIEVSDNTQGEKFIPPPGPYSSSGQKLQGQIDSTLKPVQFDLRSFKRYKGKYSPNLKAISSITWVFVDNTKESTGPLNFYLDNVGATDKPLPAELGNPGKK